MPMLQQHTQRPHPHPYLSKRAQAPPYAKENGVGLGLGLGFGPQSRLVKHLGRNQSLSAAGSRFSYAGNVQAAPQILQQRPMAVSHAHAQIHSQPATRFLAQQTQPLSRLRTQHAITHPHLYTNSLALEIGDVFERSSHLGHPSRAPLPRQRHHFVQGEVPSPSLNPLLHMAYAATLLNTSPIPRAAAVERAGTPSTPITPQADDSVLQNRFRVVGQSSGKRAARAEHEVKLFSAKKTVRRNPLRPVSPVPDIAEPEMFEEAWNVVEAHVPLERVHQLYPKMAEVFTNVVKILLRELRSSAFNPKTIRELKSRQKRGSAMSLDGLLTEAGISPKEMKEKFSSNPQEREDLEAYVLLAGVVLIKKFKPDHWKEKYRTMDEFRGAYPELVEDFPDVVDQHSIGSLLLFANVMSNVLRYVNGKGNQQRLLTLVACLSEGRTHNRYITGGAQSKRTSHRVLVYRRESNTAKISRPRRRSRTDSSDAEGSESSDLKRKRRCRPDQDPPSTTSNTLDDPEDSNLSNCSSYSKAVAAGGRELTLMGMTLSSIQDSLFAPQTTSKSTCMDIPPIHPLHGLPTPQEGLNADAAFMQAVHSLSQQQNEMIRSCSSHSLQQEPSHLQTQGQRLQIGESDFEPSPSQVIMQQTAASNIPQQPLDHSHKLGQADHEQDAFHELIQLQDAAHAQMQEQQGSEVPAQKQQQIAPPCMQEHKSDQDDSHETSRQTSAPQRAALTQPTDATHSMMQNTEQPDIYLQDERATAGRVRQLAPLNDSLGTSCLQVAQAGSADALRFLLHQSPSQMDSGSAHGMLQQAQTGQREHSPQFPLHPDSVSQRSSHYPTQEEAAHALMQMHHQQQQQSNKVQDEVLMLLNQHHHPTCSVQLQRETVQAMLQLQEASQPFLQQQPAHVQTQPEVHHQMDYHATSNSVSHHMTQQAAQEFFANEAIHGMIQNQEPMQVQPVHLQMAQEAVQAFIQQQTQDSVQAIVQQQEKTSPEEANASYPVHQQQPVHFRPDVAFAVVQQQVQHPHELGHTQSSQQSTFPFHSQHEPTPTFTTSDHVQFLSPQQHGINAHIQQHQMENMQRDSVRTSMKEPTQQDEPQSKESILLQTHQQEQECMAVHSQQETAIQAQQDAALVRIQQQQHLQDLLNIQMQQAVMHLHIQEQQQQTATHADLGHMSQQAIQAVQQQEAMNIHRQSQQQLTMQPLMHQSQETLPMALNQQVMQVIHQEEAMQTHLRQQPQQQEAFNILIQQQQQELLNMQQQHQEAISMQINQQQQSAVQQGSMHMPTTIQQQAMQQEAALQAQLQQQQEAVQMHIHHQNQGAIQMQMQPPQREVLSLLTQPQESSNPPMTTQQQVIHVQIQQEEMQLQQQQQDAVQLQIQQQQLRVHQQESVHIPMMMNQQLMHVQMQQDGVMQTHLQQQDGMSIQQQTEAMYAEMQQQQQDAMNIQFQQQVAIQNELQQQECIRMPMSMNQQPMQVHVQTEGGMQAQLQEALNMQFQQQQQQVAMHLHLQNQLEPMVMDPQAIQVHLQQDALHKHMQQQQQDAMQIHMHQQQESMNVQRQQQQEAMNAQLQQQHRQQHQLQFHVQQQEPMQSHMQPHDRPQLQEVMHFHMPTALETMLSRAPVQSPQHEVMNSQLMAINTNIHGQSQQQQAFPVQQQEPMFVQMQQNHPSELSQIHSQTQQLQLNPHAVAETSLLFATSPMDAQTHRYNGRPSGARHSRQNSREMLLAQDDQMLMPVLPQLLTHTNTPMEVQVHHNHTHKHFPSTSDSVSSDSQLLTSSSPTMVPQMPSTHTIPRLVLQDSVPVSVALQQIPHVSGVNSTASPGLPLPAQHIHIHHHHTHIHTDAPAPSPAQQQQLNMQVEQTVHTQQVLGDPCPELQLPISETELRSHSSSQDQSPTAVSDNSALSDLVESSAASTLLPISALSRAHNNGSPANLNDGTPDDQPQSYV